MLFSKDVILLTDEELVEEINERLEEKDMQKDEVWYKNSKAKGS